MDSNGGMLKSIWKQAQIFWQNGKREGGTVLMKQKSVRRELAGALAVTMFCVPS